MYPEGHAGLTLALSSLLMVPFGNGMEATIFIMVATLVSTLPDIDLKWQRKGYPIHHRGPTHSIAFAIIIGALIGFTLHYLYVTWFYFVIGLAGGFLGIMSHLLGDSLTYMAFKPLWPFSDKEVCLGICSASNKLANEVLGIIGLIGFILWATR